MSGQVVDLRQEGSNSVSESLLAATVHLDQRPWPRRRTPRNSLIVVLGEDHVLSAERLAGCLPSGERQDLEVIVACSGEPANMPALQRTIGPARFLVAPRGTCMEDLREFALRQTPGEIVTLLSGSPETAGEQAVRAFPTPV